MNTEKELNKEFESMTVDDLGLEPDAAENVVEAKVLDPEDDRDNWPVIMIDPEDGKPNYEFISVSGTKKDGKPFNHELQVMRGVNAPVPPSVVNMLNTAVSAHYTPVRDPISGRLNMIRSDRSSIPWRLVTPGKYIK